jgi:hypothetical protein
MARHQLKLDWKRPRPAPKMTHEQFVHSVAALGVELLKDEADKAQAARTKLTYGAGMAGLRGVTYFDKWLNNKAEQAHFVEICAHGEENPVQLAGTTLHELGHVLAGFQAGHGKEWHASCHKLGLRAIRAAGTHYSMAMFHPAIRGRISSLIERLNDGQPATAGKGLVKPRVCTMGIGTRGGKSRGVGSGSRLRKYVCQCGQILRASTDDLDATHNTCGTLFSMVDR